MSDIAQEDDLRYEVRDHIGYIVFNRPHARNALTFAMYERLAEICETINKSGSVKVLVLSGAGDKAFASGTDISQFRAFKTPQDALDYEARIDRVLGTLEQTRVPTIAAIVRMTMAWEANQSSSWPLSSTTCSAPTPTVSRPMPQKSIPRLMRRRYGGSKMTRRVMMTDTRPTGRLM